MKEIGGFEELCRMMDVSIAIARADGVYLEGYLRTNLGFRPQGATREASAVLLGVAALRWFETEGCHDGG